MWVYKFSLFVLILAYLDTVFSYKADDTIVKIESGRIQGHILKSEKGNNYYAFQEIPYAAKPIGLSRYRLPQPPPKWSGILNVTRNTKICYQKEKKYDNLEISEDCLYINVYTPQKPGTNPLLPVLLWIHGGGLTAESSTYEYYGPKYIIDHGVVVVTFNYRLGPFGFLGTDDNVIPLNMGLKDQHFAIEWVNRNINAFGGNPGQVTLVGESAGSLSVGYHLLGPWKDNKQLFHAVIMQSGSPIANILNVENATEEAFKLGKALDPSFDSNDSNSLLKILQNAEASDILKAGVNTGVVKDKVGIFSLEGYPTFLNKNYKDVPVLIGFNSEEWLFLIYQKNETKLDEIDANPSLLINNFINMSPENRTIAGQLLKRVYTNTSFKEDYGAYIRYTSDTMFVTSTCKQVELASNVVDYYFYQFSYKGKLGGYMSVLPDLPPDTGAVAHAEDLHYMWDDGSNSDLDKFPEVDGLMLHRYVVMWTNFVKYFNPTPTPDPLLDNFLWLKSDPSFLRYLNINSTLEMRQAPRQYFQVKEILETYMIPPYRAFT